MTPSNGDGTCPRNAAALSHFQQRQCKRVDTQRLPKGKLPLLLFGKRTGSAMLTHPQHYDAAASKSPIRQGNIAPPATTSLPPLTSSCRRRRCVLHSLAIIAGLGVANTFREACFTCLRSQVGLVILFRKGSSYAKYGYIYSFVCVFGSLWIYSNRLKLHLAGRNHHGMCI